MRSGVGVAQLKAHSDALDPRKRNQKVCSLAMLDAMVV